MAPALPRQTDTDEALGAGSGGGQGRLEGGGPPHGRTGLSEVRRGTEQVRWLQLPPLPHLRWPGCCSQWSDAHCPHGTDPWHSCKVTPICQLPASLLPGKGHSPPLWEAHWSVARAGVGSPTCFRQGCLQAPLPPGRQGQPLRAVSHQQPLSAEHIGSQTSPPSFCRGLLEAHRGAVTCPEGPAGLRSVLCAPEWLLCPPENEL